MLLDIFFLQIFLRMLRKCVECVKSTYDSMRITANRLSPEPAERLSRLNWYIPDCLWHEGYFLVNTIYEPSHGKRAVITYATRKGSGAPLHQRKHPA